MTMSAPTAPVWLKHHYHEAAAHVWVGDFTTWGEVLAVRASNGGTALTVRASDGTRNTCHVEATKRVPLMRMREPENRGVPSWCVR